MTRLNSQGGGSGGSGITELTGDVTAGPGSGSQAATIAADAVTNAQLADMAAHTFKARKTNSTGNPEDATATEATALLDALVGDTGTGGTKGLAPAPASGDAAAGKFLKADGTYAVPAGTAATNGSGRVLLGTFTASGIASLNIVTRNATGTSGAIFQSDFDIYELEFQSIYPSTNGQALFGAFSSNGGSSYISSANYSYINLRYATTGPFLSQAGGQTGMFLSINTLSNNSDWGYCGHMMLYDPLSTTKVKQWRGWFQGLESTGPVRIIEDISGVFDTTATALNAMQLYFSGNINGKVLVYGLAK